MPVKSHGESTTRTYRIWSGMKNRCNNPNNKRFASYGGRGIKVDPKWNTYEGFIEDMGYPADDLSIDRIDNDGDYTKKNCRWATARQQARNSQKALFYEGQNCYWWAEKLGVSPQAIKWRISKWGSPHYSNEARNKLSLDGKPLTKWAVELNKPYNTVRMHYYMHGHLDKLRSN